MAEPFRRARLVAASGGIDTVSSPLSVPADRAPQVQNYLPGERGRLRQRGGLIQTPVAFGAAANTFPSGHMGANIKALFGFKDLSSARYVEPWKAPWYASVTADLAKVVSAPLSVKVINFAAVPITSTNFATAGRARSPGPAHDVFGSWVYAIAYDSTGDAAPPVLTTVGSASADTVVNQRLGVERLRPLLRWNPQDTPTVDPAIYNNAPHGSQDLKFWYNRLLMLGGQHPNNAGTMQHNTIWFTRDLSTTLAGVYSTAFRDSGIDDTAYTATAPGVLWNDPVTYVVNSIEIPGDSDDFGVAFGAVGRNLAVFKRRSVHLLSGYGPDSWQIKQVASNVGCIDPRSVVEVEGAVFFLSNDGYMRYDGVEIVNVSRQIEAITNAAAAAVGDNPIITGGGFAKASRFGDYIILSIGFALFNSGGVSSYGTWILHWPTGTWSLFTSDAMSVLDAAYQGSTGTYEWASDEANIFVLNNVLTPLSEVVSSKLTLRHQTDYNGATVNTKWHSRALELAAPGERANIHRVIVDYEWVVNAVAGTTFNGPTVTVYDARGNRSLGSFILTGPRTAALVNSDIPRQRWVQDILAECDDLYVTVDYSGTARDLDRASILDVWIEYTVSAEMR